MRKFSIILQTPTGAELLFSSDSLKRAKKKFDDFANKGISKNCNLLLKDKNKIKPLYKFTYL